MKILHEQNDNPLEHEPGTTPTPDVMKERCVEAKKKDANAKGCPQRCKSKEPRAQQQQHAHRQKQIENGFNGGVG